MPVNLLQNIAELFEVAEPEDLKLFHVDASDRLWQMNQTVGNGYIQEIVLGQGLTLLIVDYHFKQNLVKQINIHRTSLEFEFWMEGTSVGESTILLHLGNPETRQFKCEVHQCLIYLNRMLRMAFCSQAIFSVFC